MVTQAVKVKNEESQSNAITGAAAGVGEKVTGTIQGTREFLHDVRVEMKQVTWPNRDDVISTTTVVIESVAPRPTVLVPPLVVLPLAVIAIPAAESVATAAMSTDVAV